MAGKPRDVDYSYWPSADPVGHTLPPASPLSSSEYLSPWSRSRRNQRNIKTFRRAAISKLDQFLNLVFTVIILLLLTRFLLRFFNVTASLFTRWIYKLSVPLILPFNNLGPILPYNHYHIETFTVVAIVAYCIVRMLIGKFLRLFA
jgi:hypothetical protein